MNKRLTDFIKVILMLGISITIITLMYICESTTSNTEPVTSIPADTVPTVPSFMNKPVNEGIKEALIYYDIQHSDIVYAQAILETGHFKSNVCNNYNNLFGLYNSNLKDYYKFEHWSESVVAYKKYIQRRYKPTENYYTFLERIHYAEDSTYTTKLKQIVKQNDKRKHIARNTGT